jgi:hypothetical protein
MRLRSYSLSVICPIKSTAPHTNPINRNPLSNPLLHQTRHPRSLSIPPLIQIIIINIQLRIRIRRSRRLKRHANKLLSHLLHERLVGIELTLFVENFVNYVPSVDFAFPVSHEGCDVVFESRFHGRGGEGGDPAGELGVPEEGMAADCFVVGGGPVDEVVPHCEAEDVGGF